MTGYSGTVLNSIDARLVKRLLFPNPFTGAITIQMNGRFEYPVCNTVGIIVMKGFA